MNKNAFSISIIFIGLILIILLFSIFGILYFFWGNVKAVQDSLSTTGSIFSAIATLGAAAIAAYLFNDWKDQKKYEIVSTLAIETHREYTYAKDKFMFYLFQHIYGTTPITYKEVDDELFMVISKLNLLDAILERFEFGIRINSEIKNVYMEGYCKVPKYYRRVEALKQFDAEHLTNIFNQAFDRDKDEKLLKKLLDIIEKVEIKK
ncbi:hypothetical protein VXR09_12090 [Acinetobacter baumannii]|uniref:hypothetical protein n=1 Tax=Acinetobacter baumannii TaxID=470 RepID=UPI000DE7A272|nr:hypothetical protein [Acinetobacter baumannii]MCT9291384.1 hypothetical protein [Acinetobacter baumannii]MDC5215465.1 hypothetical protein [Acinetobacter baumannii]MDH2566726.1 hypothetical protein [Acinetobacter baumannii]MDO7497309.1 hypothetical protein [Acinetobacter baumannii]MDV7378969.1 hypothetical protein [Acinetobacter baumannii]